MWVRRVDAGRGGAGDRNNPPACPQRSRIPLGRSRVGPTPSVEVPVDRQRIGRRLPRCVRQRADRPSIFTSSRGKGFESTEVLRPRMKQDRRVQAPFASQSVNESGIAGGARMIRTFRHFVTGRIETRFRQRRARLGIGVRHDFNNRKGWLTDQDRCPDRRPPVQDGLAHAQRMPRKRVAAIFRARRQDSRSIWAPEPKVPDQEATFPCHALIPIDQQNSRSRRFNHRIRSCI